MPVEASRAAATLGLLQQLDRLLTLAEQQHHALAMGIQTDLLTDEIRAGQSQSAGLDEQNRQGAVVAAHPLKIQSLANRPLRPIGAESLHQGGPEVVHGLQGRKIQLSIRHQDGSRAIASMIICGVTAILSSGSALSR